MPVRKATLAELERNAYASATARRAPIVRGGLVSSAVRMSGKGRLRSISPLNTNGSDEGLFNDLIGAHEDRWRDGQAERLGGPEIDHQLKRGRLLDRQIS